MCEIMTTYSAVTLRVKNIYIKPVSNEVNPQPHFLTIWWSYTQRYAINMDVQYAYVILSFFLCTHGFHVVRSEKRLIIVGKTQLYSSQQ